MPKPKEEKKVEYDFGGPNAAAAIIIGLPLFMNVLYLACNDVSGCPAPALLSPRSLTWPALRAQMPWPEEGLRGFASWSATAAVLGYYLVSLVLHRVLPAAEVRGTKLRESGKTLLYRFNAFSSTVVQLVACAAGTYLHGADFVVWRYITDNYLQLLTAHLLLSFIIAIAVYWGSFSVIPGNPQLRELAHGGHTGSVVYDFFIGRELNPRWTLPLGLGEVDLKTWLGMRPGLTGWALLNCAFIAQQYRNYGYLSDSILCVALAQGYYVLEGQWAEGGILGMMDFASDGLGFMLVFGDMVWVPFLYSTQCRYLAMFPVHMGPLGVAGVLLTFGVGVYIFRASNAQKIAFRKDPDAPRFKGATFIQTKRGTKLLTSGWWGMARHINYFGDWLQSLPFSLPTGLAGFVVLPAGSVAAAEAAAGGAAKMMLDGRVLVAGDAAGWGMLVMWFYSAWFAWLLIHRERRDDRACAEKYGDDWVAYKKEVPWRILPGVY
ncbi:Delta14-sterol reductase [Microdochium nivale]|nr:Delta14-sterol reductase [Microdochium nivale]